MHQKSLPEGPEYCFLRSLLAAMTLALLASACTVTSLDGRRMPVRSDDFANYVESVFRDQNDVANDLVLILDAADPGSIDYAALEDAEFDLFEACRGLNEIASSRRDGESIGGLKALRRARRAPDCERAADAAAELLAPDGVDEAAQAR